VPLTLEGSTAIVTGGGSGLGATTARELAQRGARVALLDVDGRAAGKVAGEIGQGAVSVEADVTHPDAVARAIGEAADDLGTPRVAVCCHGVLGPGRVLRRQGAPDVAGFSTTVGVNLVGAYNVLAGVAHRMSTNEPDENGERGVIVLTASIAGYEGQIGQVGYAASKAGILGLVLPAARDLAGLGIRVMAIAPGTFDTPMLASLPETVRDELGAQIPFPPRLGRPSEFADLVCHIATNPALNGTAIRLDGALRLPPR
jgi:NAD(P)-dependent dehydrogenase (short-subunit alcohol dehydrogenase family)